MPALTLRVRVEGEAGKGEKQHFSGSVASLLQPTSAG